ncbi:bifunctional aminoglycoside phosphotransferase/ATP-binding protein [Parafrankia discariae]|uniref:bifunctional aminoglycoside phosphotransferase/ATP-binding protein n=1 Tax=Parafrankia discariae TaxID=365528 RepID=UPI00036C6D7D|nr:AAA family ATPase [Parafrankia discariae]
MFVQKDAFPGQDTEVRPEPSEIPGPEPVRDQAVREIRLDSRETVQTPTAVVFLTEDRAYKLRRAANHGFVDFRPREARLTACEDEVRLNRRLAPDVYLGVADIRDDTGALRDHMVVMRRLPADRRLSALVPGDVSTELRALARRIAAFHAGCETTPEITRTGGLCALEALWLEAMDGLTPFRGRILDAGTVDEIGRLALRYLTGRGPLLARRQAAGRIRDGHGDLLADDIYCLDDGPRVLNCVSVDPALRAGDVLGAAAGLALDLERLGDATAARTFLDAYREFSGETGPASLEHLHIAYRAVVRARTACVRDHQGDPAGADEARRLTDIALSHLRRGRPRLILVGGLPGTGKSTLARHLATAGDDWVLLSSDAARGEPAGPVPGSGAAETEAEAGDHGANAGEHSYAELLTRARQELEGGRSVVIDASWSSRRVRALAADLATECDADLVQLRCVVPPQVAVARIADRAAAPAAAASGQHTALANAPAPDEWSYLGVAIRTDPWPDARDIDTSTPVEQTVTAAHLLTD